MVIPKSVNFLILSSLITLIQAIDLGEKCTDNYYCHFIPNAECINQICQCMEGTTLHNTNCLQDFNPKQSCSDTSECKAITKESICLGEHCKCVGNHHFRDGQCHNNRGYKAYCTSSDECNMGLNYVGSMVCKGNSCECNDGYKHKEGRCRNNSPLSHPIVGLVLLTNLLIVLFK